MQVLIRLASELSIKTPRIRARFVRRMTRNLRDGMRAAGIPYRIKSEWSRLYVDSDHPGALDVLQRIFGIESLSPVEWACEPTEEALTEAILRYTTLVQGKTFAIRVKRSGLPGRTSVDWERFLGSLLWSHSAGVSLKSPQVRIEVELRPNQAYIFTQRLRGAGGLPLGVQGKVLSLFSGGIDSSVAAWSLMRRGCESDFLFFNLGGSAYERSVLAAARGLMRQWSNGYTPMIHIVPFQEVAAMIKQRVQPQFAQVVLKRLMYRGASRMAAQHGALALVTGESVGQVSSQTLHNLRAIDTAADMMVLRPLIGQDKEDIIETAKRIGTLALTEHVQEHCALVLKRPVTATTPEKAAQHELDVPVEVFEASLAAVRSVSLDTIDDAQLLADYVYIDQVPEQAAVIDCRSQVHFEAWHYQGAVRHDPEWLLSHFSSLPKDQKYVLYCPYGLQSAFIAEKMQQAGFEAYSLRGGTTRLRT